ncbi:beta-eliminating lyase-related protein [Acuticoccus sp. MNP-M23]|uniref:threonine aldolase family protein n=1 Tax=Acuticoccus sp. MNP-M23 TaxID=3072793 RepID=UPI002815B89C|nr:beta-eliminating lyase-related protein [Acuticoccus sp. MNP-M23]WMS41299.1 beta-eliminating lyase-related protein [Acuticoccus sp. MNP-M23]
MSFGSDNWAGAADAVMATLAEANDGQAPAYGDDAWTGRACDLLRQWFERDVSVFFVSTGTAANSLALALYSKPGGAVMCHVDAHLARDEAGGPLLFAPGTQLDVLDGAAGRITTEGLSARLAQYPPGVVHHGRPAVVSITNVNEIGQCYTAADIAELAALAHGRDCALHMDGARFANALAHTGAAPADITWRAGVDVLSLGFTKTGGWAAEAVVLFDTALREDAAYRHKQAAQLFSKNRFASAQFVALLRDNHVLGLAGHANAMAARIATTLEASGAASLVMPTQSNEVFAFVSPEAVARLNAAGIVCAPYGFRSAFIPEPPQDGWELRRFVASFRTSDGEIDALAKALAG